MKSKKTPCTIHLNKVIKKIANLVRKECKMMIQMMKGKLLIEMAEVVIAKNHLVFNLFLHILMRTLSLLKMN